MIKFIQLFNHFPYAAYSLFNITHSSGGFFTSQPMVLEKKSKELEVGKWIGGKPNGKVIFKAGEFVIKNRNAVINKFDIAQFQSKEKAEIYGKQFLYNFCKEKDELINEYRICMGEDGEFLEFKAKKVIVQCNVEHRDIVEKYEWLYDAKFKWVYRKIKKGIVKFQQDLFNDGRTDNVKYIDGNHLNYRIENLKPKY